MSNPASINFALIISLLPILSNFLSSTILSTHIFGEYSNDKNCTKSHILTSSVITSEAYIGNPAN